MPANYTLIEKITVGAAGASSVTFSGIPQTGYTDLVVKVSARSTRNNSTYPVDNLNIAFNGASAGVNVSERALYTYNTGSTQTITSDNDTYLNQFMIKADGSTASTFSNGEFYIPNYASSTAYKSINLDSTAEDNSAKGWLMLTAGLSLNTAPITSINMYAASGSLAQYSTFSLYGVAKLGTTPAIQPYATGGDTIMTDGTYWYHAFKSSGTFTPAKALSCDVLVVAGGGGGSYPGGGGAGGILAFASQSLASGTGYTATVGGGGSAGVSATYQGTQGSNSQFASLTAAVGGGRGGAQPATKTGGDGGSGGGASFPDSGTGTEAGGLGTSGQGFAGGTGQRLGGGGGGGGGAVGQAANASGSNQGGTGGIGLNTVTNWGSLSAVLTATGLGSGGYLAGGGGGASWATYNAAGGTGGGGTGSASASTTGVTAGTANTGGGGGGAVSGAAAGGSGLVIVRYAV